LKPELEDLKKKVAPYAEQDEDVLSYALFEQVATKFFDQRKAAKLNLDEGTADKQAKIHTV
jgi:oxaloacetate decarboxylase alpha subunit